MTFKWKNSILITIVISVILMGVNVLINVTFHSLSQDQQRKDLKKEIDFFKEKINDPHFYNTFVKPYLGKNKFPIKMADWREDLEEGQYLTVKSIDGSAILEEHVNVPVNMKGTEKTLFSISDHINLPPFGECVITIKSPIDSGALAIIRMNELLLTIATFLGVVLTSIAAYFISKMTIRPVSNIIKRVQAIDVHNLKEQLDLPKTKDEIYDLTQTFNDLLANLEKSFEQQRWFIADASHELKTPIAVIEGHTDMLKRWGKESPEILEESIEFINQETKRMKNLVNQLLLLASIESTQQEEKWDCLNIVQLITDICQSIQTLKPAVSIQVSAKPDNIYIKSNRFILEHILINLIDNAVKYTQPEGFINVYVQEKDQDICIIIKDTGIGIRKEDLPNIFNRFYRADKSRSRKSEGTGLGLAITKNLISRLNGTIKIESEERKGTTVFLTIPLNSFEKN